MSNTVRDQPQPEGWGAGQQAPQGLGRVNLVPVLAERFRVVRDLGRFGESDLLLVVDRDDIQWVIKQYAPGWAPDGEVLDTLSDLLNGWDRDSWTQDAERRHLIYLDSFGMQRDWNVFFEVQEYIPGGSLEGRLSEWPVRDLAGALARSILHFHRNVGTHRDVTPSNVLVRGRVGPVLLLSDMGLARSVTGVSGRWSTRDGTLLYQAPEASSGYIATSGDLWSVGMILAEAALRRHPLTGPDGQPDAELVAHLSTEGVPGIDAIDDEPLRATIRGLLELDPESRWRPTKVLETLFPGGRSDKDLPQEGDGGG